MQGSLSDDQVRDIEQRAGQFSLLLVKALLQTGTYAPGHPMARAASDEMYVAFRQVAEYTDELTYLLLSTVDDEGILVDGLLDEPIPVKKVFRGVMGDHFLGKFHDYFARNRIASFSIKSTIPPEAFEDFLGYLTSWFSETNVGHRSAEEFSKQLLELGILDVSIISMDEVVGGKRHLAWPVKIALSRMRKDISKLPMMRNVDRATIQRMKVSAMSDVIRPINRHDLLRDLLLNADLVADGIQITSFDEVEDTLVLSMSPEAAFGVMEMLMGIVEELNSSKARVTAVGRSLDELRETTTRILSKLLSKLAMIEYRAAFPMLEVAYSKGYIKLEELPKDLQRKLRAGETTDKFLSNAGQYLSDFDTCNVPQNYLKYLNVFNIVLPELVDRGNRSMVSSIMGLLYRHVEEGDMMFQGRTHFVKEGLKLLEQSQFMNGLVMMAVNTPKEERAELEGGAALFGDAIVPALIGYLTSDNDMTVRSTVSAILLRIGQPAIEPLTDELRAHRHGWQPLRSIIRLLGQLKAVNAEKNIFQYASHPHPKVREECLTALYEILGPDAEKYLVSFVQDPEKLVARRAITELALLHSTNTGYLDFLYNTIRVRNRNEDEPDESLQAVCLRALAEYHKVLMPKDPDIESALIDVLSTKGLKTLLPGRMGVRTKSAELRALAVYALAARGGEKNEKIIEGLKNADDTKVADAATEALNRLAQEHQVFSAPNAEFDPWANPVD